MKTSSYLLPLLSLVSRIAADGNSNTREVKRTEAQKFADVSNPQLLTMQQLKKKKNVGGGSVFANKLKVAMGELHDNTTAESGTSTKKNNKREPHGSTNIIPKKKTANGKIAAPLTMAQQIEKEQNEGREEALSKLSLNLGEAIKAKNKNKRASSSRQGA